MEECESTENEIQVDNGNSKEDIQEESTESSLVSILKLQLKEVCIKNVLEGIKSHKEEAKERLKN